MSIVAEIKAFATLSEGTHHVAIRIIHVVDGWEHHCSGGEHGVWWLIVSVVCVESEISITKHQEERVVMTQPLHPQPIQALKECEQPEIIREKR